MKCPDGCVDTTNSKYHDPKVLLYLVILGSALEALVVCDFRFVAAAIVSRASAMQRNAEQQGG